MKLQIISLELFGNSYRTSREVLPTLLNRGCKYKEQAQRNKEGKDVPAVAENDNLQQMLLARCHELII